MSTGVVLPFFSLSDAFLASCDAGMHQKVCQKDLQTYISFLNEKQVRYAAI